jgi:hypothetical protein
VDKKGATSYLIKKKKNEKVIAFNVNKKANMGKGAKRIWVPKKIISTMKSTKKVYEASWSFGTQMWYNY